MIWGAISQRGGHLSLLMPPLIVQSIEILNCFRLETAHAIYPEA